MQNYLPRTAAQDNALAHPSARAVDTVNPLLHRHFVFKGKRCSVILSVNK
jgi:hypothetical protein